MAHQSLAPTLEIFERLIAFDTRSSESNLPLIEYVRGVLRGYGIEATLVHDATGTKANLFATIGPQDRPGLFPSGHTDVVPAGGQPWTVPAFEMTRAADRVLGRGMADMKGFLAVVLAMVPRFIGLFQAIGVPTVVCGPGSIEQAHKADEYVTLAQLSQCMGFVDVLAQRIAAGPLAT